MKKQVRRFAKKRAQRFAKKRVRRFAMKKGLAMITARKDVRIVMALVSLVLSMGALFKAANDLYEAITE
ncbi:MAG: hypothetical protein ACJ8CB_28540 [Ktedonobacteraceae bacterium]